MPNLFASLGAAAGALRAFERALSVSQNNVNNAATPGFARQRVHLQALPFQSSDAGGVIAGGLSSSRNAFAERSVRQGVEVSVFLEQRVASLERLENALPVAANSGLPAAMGSLFRSFAAWAQNPGALPQRQDVIYQADNVAQAFRATATALAATQADTDVEIQNAATDINRLASQLAGFNAQMRAGARDDAGLDAAIHNTLEQLSELADTTVLQQEDGTFTVLLGGQAPLVIGDTAAQIEVAKTMPLTPAYPGGAPTLTLLDQDGRDLGPLVTGGKMGALLGFRNQTLANLAGDAEHLGELNRLAMAFADRVNGIIGGGWVEQGQPGAARLFAYDTTRPVAAAATLSLDPAVTAANLPAMTPGPPLVSNGVAVELSGLSSETQVDLDAMSFVQFYGSLASVTGNELQQARTRQDYETQLLAHARSWRDQLSAVSLDEEAILLLEFQRAYEATARVVTVLDELTEETINLLR
jgi:flagellar hook-associated protein 1 FlgK